jgi:hypothetical protein
MRELLPALTDEEKTEIKRELDHIGKMILTFEYDDYYLSITLRHLRILNGHFLAEKPTKQKIILFISYCDFMNDNI